MPNEAVFADRHPNDAFFQNIHWDEVNRRLERAEKAALILRAQREG